MYLGRATRCRKSPNDLRTDPIRFDLMDRFDAQLHGSHVANHEVASRGPDPTNGARSDLVYEDPVFLRVQKNLVAEFQAQFTEALMVEIDIDRIAPFRDQLYTDLRSGGVHASDRGWKALRSARDPVDLQEMRPHVDRSLA